MVKDMQRSELRRSKLQILADILRLCKSLQAKTRIMQKTNISYTCLQNNFIELKKLRLIELRPETTKYAITQRGFDFLKKWKKIQELLVSEDQIVFTKLTS
jgi:predicted transcriptional regulator